MSFIHESARPVGTSRCTPTSRDCNFTQVNNQISRSLKLLRHLKFNRRGHAAAGEERAGGQGGRQLLAARRVLPGEPDLPRRCEPPGLRRQGGVVAGRDVQASTGLQGGRRRVRGRHQEMIVKYVKLVTNSVSVKRAVAL